MAVKKTDKKVVSKASAKPAPKKVEKPAPKKVAKPAPKKVEEKPKKAPEKKSGGSVYHVSKRDDGKWEIKLAKIAGKAGATISLHDTKEEAMAAAKELSESQNRKVLVHKSKGPNKGKVHKI